ncbi:alpha/beta hydrolase [Streptomyces sp. WZ.A104]|uniref:alpha/beta fold hydrolase n=1 Tax=Streptomyces sp. WZ.A104 TaxID=2023771 RepID=UPI000BBCF4C6|nr:alpha/beta hydrolase [Streptomyces sp. WZ.A104]PCG84743.1 alpha/beta hydrolase [Streptomyces sp. WZ.A104]
MPSVYRSTAAQQEVRRWCLSRLDAWHVAHVRREVATSAGPTSVVTLGPEPRGGAQAVVLLPGTNMNAALCPAIAEALAREHRVVILDLPGQPGLSSGRRPRAGRTDWYGRWLSEVLPLVVREPAVVVGHSLGGAVALAGDSPLIAGRVLLSSAGVTRLRVPVPLVSATVPWLLRPSVPRAEELLRHMSAPGRAVPGHLSAWMDLVARCCRTSLAPAPLPPALLERSRAAPVLVATGRFDLLLPPRVLGPAAQRRLGVGLRVVEGSGHLLLDEAPVEVCGVVEEFLRAHGAQ